MDYTPDRRITKYLREYDSGLGARWNRDLERWEITWRGELVFRVQNDDGSYRNLDDRVLTHIALIDAMRVGDATKVAKEITEHNHRLTLQQRQRFSDHIQQVAKEDIYNAVFGSKRVTPGVDVGALS